MDFVSNILANSISGFVEAGTRSLGGYAGDALIKAGDVIENTGRNVGTSVENTAAYYGAKLSGQVPPKTSSYSQKALPAPEPQKLITYPYSGGAKSASNKNSTGAYKKPGGAAAKSGAYGSKAVVPYKSAPSVSGNKSTTTTAQKKALPKPYPNNIAYPSSKANSNAKANSNTKALSKPYPNNSNAAQKSYSSGKKAPVTRGHSVPFVAPDNKSTQKSTQYGSTQPGKGNSNNGQKSYPGQGDNKRTAVKKYKPAETYKPPFEKGAAVHIPQIKV